MGATVAVSGRRAVAPVESGGICVNCFTSIDALAFSAAGGSALAAGAWGRARDVLSGRSATRRRQETWDHNAAFVAGLDLEPCAVLGRRPTSQPTRPRTRPPAPARELALARSPDD